jgi:hypothetical protein
MKTYKYYIQASKCLISSPIVSEKLEKDELEYLYLGSILLSWIGFESYINAMCESLSKGTRITEFQRAFLLEEDYKVNDNGEVGKITSRPPTLKKLIFIIQNFTNIDAKSFKQTSLWNRLRSFEDLRNKIVHHKEKNDFDISLQDAFNCQNLVIETVAYLRKLLTSVSRNRSS